MIKEVIKFDGRTEPYQSKKLSGWGQWAADHLDGLVDWPKIVARTEAVMPEVVKSQDLQEQLIKECLDQRSWSHYLMAGRLYAIWLSKRFYGNGDRPTVKQLHERMIALNVMRRMDYSDADYEYVESLIDHDRDLDCPHFSLHHTREKYALKNRVTGAEYETQQYTYMRMAMALSEYEPRDKRLEVVEGFYRLFSMKKLSAPTPNYVNLGTHLRGLASCCLYAAGDDGTSLAIGDYIANIMTQSSAGIGNNLMVRSTGNPVRGGLIKHMGKKPYYTVMAKAVKANMQNGRGGAGNTYYNGFDPDAFYISQLRNPRATEDNRLRDIHYTMMANAWFAHKVAVGEEVLAFNPYTAPELYEALYHGDIKRFVRLYKQHERNPLFVKNYFSARDLVVGTEKEALETGTAYHALMDEMNRHTPFLEPVLSSNLCTEIAEVSAPYYDMMHLYAGHEVGAITFTDTDGRQYDYPAHTRVKTDRGELAAVELEVGDALYETQNGPILVAQVLKRTPQPEVALCSLAAVNQPMIKSDAEYEEVMYYGYKMIDYCIHNSEYKLPHVGFTAKQRMNAGIGIMGVATHMARRRLRYSSVEGKIELHKIAERHMYMAIRASLRISKERGVAPWMRKTKWPKGWLPIDTYNRNVDRIAPFTYQYDWEALRVEVVANGGIGHSCLVAYMPGEASSKALGACNSLYPTRELELYKSDNNTKIRWAAPFGDDAGYMYELAWDIPTRDMIDCYAIFQKFTDQSISADFYRKLIDDEQVPSSELIQDYLYMCEMGMKTRYYYNTLTTSGVDLDDNVSGVRNNTEERGCASGACDV